VENDIMPKISGAFLSEILVRQDKQHVHVNLVSILGLQALKEFLLFGCQIPVSSYRGNIIKVQLFRVQGFIKLFSHNMLLFLFHVGLVSDFTYNLTLDA
jgi:hypothetical protein